MEKPRFELKPKGNYIDGEFHFQFDSSGEWTAKSPADFTDVLGQVRYSYASVDEAVKSARTALDFWREKENRRARRILKEVPRSTEEAPRRDG